MPENRLSSPTVFVEIDGQQKEIGFLKEDTVSLSVDESAPPVKGGWTIDKPIRLTFTVEQEGNDPLIPEEVKAVARRAEHVFGTRCGRAKRYPVWQQLFEMQDLIIPPHCLLSKRAREGVINFGKRLKREQQ